jgi:MoaA/NifB/PqqE/SkfB family radical SAM enzyme
MAYTLLKTSHDNLYWCRELNQFFLLYGEKSQAISVDHLAVERWTTLALGVPLNLVWRITTRCNLACPHCFSRQNTTTAAEEGEIREKVLAELLLLAPPKVNFTGGEPVLTPNFASVLKKLKQKSVITTLTSNGLALQDYLDEISDYVDWFIISIDHYLPAVHDALRRRSGLFQRSIQTVERLVTARKMTRINSVISQKNLADMENMVLYFRDLNVHCHELIQFLPKNQAVEVQDEYAIDQELFLSRARALKKYETDRFKIKINANATFREYVIIEDDGWLYTVDTQGEYRRVSDSLRDARASQYEYRLPVLKEC